MAFLCVWQMFHMLTVTVADSEMRQDMKVEDEYCEAMAS